MWKLYHTYKQTTVLWPAPAWWLQIALVAPTIDGNHDLVIYISTLREIEFASWDSRASADDLDTFEALSLIQPALPQSWGVALSSS